MAFARCFLHQRHDVVRVLRGLAPRPELTKKAALRGVEPVTELVRLLKLHRSEGGVKEGSVHPAGDFFEIGQRGTQANDL